MIPFIMNKWQLSFNNRGNPRIPIITIVYGKMFYFRWFRVKIILYWLERGDLT